MNDPSDLAAFRALAWERLSLAVEQNTPMRQVALASVGQDGAPEVRTVVLRTVDPNLSQVTIHTDLGSSKVRSFRSTPIAEVLAWDPAVEVQVRLRARVRVAQGGEVAHLWPGVPVASRAAYGAQPAPGTPIPGPFDYRKPSDPAGFAVLWCDGAHLDVTQLGARHRRALFDVRNGWTGQWVAP